MRPAFIVSYFMGRFRGLACNKHAFLSPVLLHQRWSRASVTIQINRINIHFKFLGTPAVSWHLRWMLLTGSNYKICRPPANFASCPPHPCCEEWWSVMVSHLNQTTHLALLWRSNGRGGDQYRGDNELIWRGKLPARWHEIFGVSLGFTRERLGGSGALRTLEIHCWLSKNTGINSQLIVLLCG